RAWRQNFRQRPGQWTVKENAAGLIVSEERLQRKRGSKPLVQSPHVAVVADQKVAGLVRFQVPGQSLERHFGADPGEVAECDADPAGHGCFGTRGGMSNGPPRWRGDSSPRVRWR